MKTAIRFENVVKNSHGSPLLRIDDLRIAEGECVAYYGLPDVFSEPLINLVTGATMPDEGVLEILGTDVREISDEAEWFRFVENVGIYGSHQSPQDGVSIGENIAALYRLKDESMAEPQLSASVLALANLVHLTITDLSRMVGEASATLRMKIRLARALAYHPKILVLTDPTTDLAPELFREFVELIRRTRRKLRYTLLFFTSDIWLLEQLSDRVIFLNPVSGLFIENQLREWYHRLFSFLSPPPSQLLKLSQDVLQYGRSVRTTEEKL